MNPEGSRVNLLPCEEWSDSRAWGLWKGTLLLGPPESFLTGACDQGGSASSGQQDKALHHLRDLFQPNQFCDSPAAVTALLGSCAENKKLLKPVLTTPPRMVPLLLGVEPVVPRAGVSAELGSSAASFTAELLVRISHRLVWCQSAQPNLVFSQNRWRWVTVKL